LTTAPSEPAGYRLEQAGFVVGRVLQVIDSI